MSIKIYFITAHLDYSEELGKCFNQDILTIEDRYQGNVTINILDDYCWSLHKCYKILKIEKNH